jgi:hypothetical protein
MLQKKDGKESVRLHKKLNFKKSEKWGNAESGEMNTAAVDIFLEP